MTGRKGVAHALEAIIAAFVLFVFILSITNLGGTDPAARTTTIQKQTINILHALDVNGSLRPAVEDQDLSSLTSLVADHVQTRNVEIALLTVNSTSTEASFTTQYTDTFQVTGAAEQEELRLWYRDAAAPNVSINGAAVSNNTGTLTDQYETLDISAETVNGENTVQIDVAGSSSIGYSIDVYNRQQSGQPPTDSDVFTTSYLVSGGNTTFAPAEVTVISWN